MSGDLVAFLRARLDGDERRAEFIHHVNCGNLVAQSYELPDPCDCETPARVLAEVQVKRRIIALHKSRGVEGGPPYEWTCAFCDHAPVPWERYIEWPCVTLRLLALPYAEHPDYQAEWSLTLSL